MKVDDRTHKLYTQSTADVKMAKHGEIHCDPSWPKAIFLLSEGLAVVSADIVIAEWRNDSKFCFDDANVDKIKPTSHSP